MAERIKRKIIDFVANDYKTVNRHTEILTEKSDLSKIGAQPENKNNFIQRWYLSLQGEDTPVVSAGAFSHESKAEQRIYRYDWAFGMTLLEGFWWNWQEDLRKENALAVHLLLQPSGDAPEIIPVAGTLSALHPSRNTKSIWDTAWPKIPKAAAELAKIGSSALPALEYASSSLLFASNVLESHTENQKNWFLYQFFDEKLKCPTVEWRINKQVIIEYGPLLRGSLYAVFHGSTELHPGHIRIQLRPQAGYYEGDDLTSIVPTNKFEKDQQVYIDVKPRDI
ncbi:MAG TPA: hypothetical protein VFA71_02185 [Terriglobales bacterium]|nr:hypothetical protein [Terriglobales bacterium]